MRAVASFVHAQPHPDAVMCGVRPRPARLTRFLLVVAAATVVGCALRVWMAWGDLGLDEIWSLRLVGTLNSVGAVFWGLSHDNNHFLNSAWLYLLGPDQPALADRAVSLVLGCCTVPAMALWCRRRGEAAGMVGAVAAAVSFPLVDFGSEARGYAGLVLASVVAFDQAQRAIDAGLIKRRGIPPEAWRLGAAVGFGLLSHLAMIDTVAVIGCASLGALAWQARRLRSVLAGPVLASSVKLFAPSLLFALPAIGCVLAGVVVTGRFRIGDAVPFAYADLLDGYGGLLLLTLGLPDRVPPLVGLALVAGVIGLAARARMLSRQTLWLSAAAFLVFPLAVALARLPNVGYARYYALDSVVLIAVVAEVLGALFEAGTTRRRQAALLGACCAAGSLILDVSAIGHGRSGAAATLAIMRGEGRPRYATDHPAMSTLLLETAAKARKLDVPAIVDDAAFCSVVPDWYIAVGVYDPRPDGTTDAGPETCRTQYRVRATFESSPLSGTQWTLYRRF